MYNGRWAESFESAKRAISYYDPVRHRDLVFETGRASVVSAYNTVAYTAFMLGFPEQGLAAAAKAVHVADQAAHPQDLLFVLQFAGTDLHHLAGEPEKVLTNCDRLRQLGIELDSAGAMATATFLLGWADAELGRVSEGIEQMEAGLAAFRATGTVARTGRFAADLGEAYGKLGEPQKGLTIIAAAQAERQTQFAEIFRIEGDLYRAAGRGRDAENSYQKALSIAREEGQRMFELRAATQCARLLLTNGDRDGAHDILVSVHDWFTEGFETTDLIEAKALLAELK
jgi:tetratricopeptide (TPR) repeat protein